MELNLYLSPETEQRLRQQAQAAGLDIQSFVLEALEQRLGSHVEGSDVLSDTLRQRIEKLNTWAQSHRLLPFEADDSRDGIYEGRGE